MFAFVKAFQTRRQSKTGLIHHLYGMVQVVRFHHGQQRPEKFGHMGVTSGADVILDARGPHIRIVIEVLRLKGPGFAMF